VPHNDWAKREALRRLIREAEPTLNNAIVFCNRKRDVDVVAKSLAKHGFDAAPIHGDLDQSLRMKTLERFRGGELKILVASDVAARGLDVPSVSHVFNFDVPIHADDYVHRIGRTGRAGRTGQAYMLSTPKDAKYVDVIEKLTGKPMARREMLDIEVREDVRPRRDFDKDGRGGRGGRDKNRRGRDGRSHDRRPPDGKFHDHVASMEPATVSADAAPVTASVPAETAAAPQEAKPARAEQAPRPERSHQDRPRNEQRPRQDNRDRGEKRERGSQRQHNERAARPEPVDHSELPAFLFRPIPVRKPEPQAE